MKLFIYGTIGAEVKSADIVSQIGNNKDDNIDVFINSPGGSVYEGFAIFNALQRESATKEIKTFIDGLAYSAASWISQAAPKGNRFMSKASQFGIHQAINFEGGNKEDLENQVEQLAKIDEVQEFIYSEASGLSKKAIREIMQAGKTLFFKEAISNGFIDGEAVPQKIAAYFNTDNMDLEKLKALFAGSKGEESLPEIKEEVKATLAEKLEKAETPAEVLGKDFAKAEDFETYKANVEPILQGIFDYIKEQPKAEDIEKMIKEATADAMKDLLSQVRSSKQIPTAEESGFNEQAQQVESYGPLTMNKNFFELQNETE